MDETTAPPVERPRQLHFEWFLPLLVRPRRAFESITAQTRGVWLTALLLLSVTTVLRVIVAGVVGQADPMAGQVDLPPDFQYYSPEQQAQFMQAAQATSGPVFVYVLPAIGGLLGVWLGWLIVSSITHLVLTLQGGRATTMTTANIVAWAGLPFAVRDVVRVVAMLVSNRLISSPGVSGFIAADATGFMLFLGGLLALLDVYVIWHVALIVTGVRAADASFSRIRAWISVVLTILLIMALQALLGFLGAQISGLTVMRPFLF